MMPVLDGVVFTERLKNMKETRHIPVVVITSSRVHQ
jgi:CheY-like chemotaxis protein